MRIRTLVLGLLAFTTGALASSAAAGFSDRALFAAPAISGGGEGRYFTGSPVDGFGCGVCHGGGAPPLLALDGLPAMTEPGRRYEVSVRWAGDDSHALHLELVDGAGGHPAVELSHTPDHPNDERCDGDPEATPAVYSVDVGMRRVIGVQDCGARSVSFAFTAPAGPVVVSLGAVRSDGSATPEGDGVLEIRETLPSTASGAGGCATSPRPGARWHGGAAILVMMAAAFRRRRRSGDRRDCGSSHTLPRRAGASMRVLSEASRVVLGALLAVLPACFEPAIPSDAIPAEGADELPVELFDHPDGGVPDACPGSRADVAPIAGLRVRVRTSQVGGKFAPRNVGAIWIARPGEVFVKTLERWASTRAKWLVTWNEASDGNVVDAITGATKTSHETHEVRWDLADVAGCPVGQGNYELWMELTDKSGPGVTHRIPFSLDPSARDLAPEDAPSFHDLSLTWER